MGQLAKAPLAVYLAALISFSAIPVRGDLQWQFQGDFSTEEQAALQRWITLTHESVETVVGELPVPLYIRFIQSESGQEPVPWANTNKGRRLGVNFYVSTQHHWAAFYQDWTASHELVHMVHPYLGEDAAWFSEGLASYLQYQVMFAAGELSWPEVIERLEERFSAARRSRDYGVSIPALSENRSRYRSNVRMYWGGAALFLEADRQLAQQGESVNRLLARYAQCCQHKRWHKLPAFVDQLDSYLAEPVLAPLVSRWRNQQYFPETTENLEWLAARGITLPEVNQ